MTLQEQYIERLRCMVEAKFGRSITTAEDCHILADVVAEATNMHLDANAYASLFMPQPGVATRPVVLSALTQYVGFGSWSDFCTSADVTPAEDIDKIPTPRYWGVAILTALAVIVVVISAVLLLDDGHKEDISSEVVVELVASVEERWSARTLEECNAVRAYFDDEDYAERVDSFIEEYCAALYDDISSELTHHAQQANVELLDEDIAHYAENITVACRAMCNALIEEQK